MNDFLSGALAGGASSLIVMGLLGWWLRRPAADRPEAGAEEGVSDMPPWVTYGIAGIFMALAITCIVIAVLEPEDVAREPVPWALLVGVSGAFGILATIAARADTSVRWDALGIEGQGHFFLTKRSRIPWDRLVRAGTLAGSWYFTDGERRVYWSFLYGGHPAIAAAIRHHRPDLALPNGAD